MKDSCSSVSRLLEKYFDQEATDKERSLVEDHLAGCLSCQDTLEWMGDFRDSVKTPVKMAVQKEDFERAWQNIRREIQLQEKSSWWKSIQSWLDLPRFFRKKVWVPAVAVVAIFALLTTQVFFEEASEEASYGALPDVEYVDSSYNVMVYAIEKSKITVIWLFEGQEMEAPSS